MTDSISVSQRAAIGSNTTQIANQNNYYGLTPIEASKLAVELFMDNFPRLQEEAMKTVQSRVDELIANAVTQIEQKYAGNYSAFSKPDMQYILVEAEKGYARKGTAELCALLSSLIADRSACRENSYMEMILDKAIELAPSLLPSHLDYLTLIFLYKHVQFRDLSTLEDIKIRYEEIHNCFQSPTNSNMIPYFNMLGLFTIALGDGAEVLGKTYGFTTEEVASHLPREHVYIASDYGLTPVGIVLAIFNAHSKGKWHFNLSTWIAE